MTVAKRAHPLSYFAEVLSQMTDTLKDFDMRETATLLERAKADIECCRRYGAKGLTR